MVERALILKKDGPLTFDEVIRVTDDQRQYSSALAPGRIQTLDEVIYDHNRRALDASAGKIRGPYGAAALLGINPGTLRHRMRWVWLSDAKKD